MTSDKQCSGAPACGSAGCFWASPHDCAKHGCNDTDVCARAGGAAPCIPVPQPAPQPATERAGDDEPKAGVINYTEMTDDYCLSQIYLIASSEDHRRVGAPIILAMVEEIKRLRKANESLEERLPIYKRVAHSHQRTAINYLTQRDDAYDENDKLSAELAELKRLGVAAALARIASGEAGE